MRDNSWSATHRMPSLLDIIVYCTCGHLFRENQSSRGILRWTLDLLSIPNYVIKKGRPHGHRYGKIKEQKEHLIAHNLRRRCIKRGFEGIHDRFQKDSNISWISNQHWSNWRSLHPDGQGRAAQKDFTYRMAQAEYFRYRKNWWIPLNKSGKIGPVRDRSDFNGKLTTVSRLHQESGERHLRPVPFWEYQQWHSSSSSSSSWWQWNDSWWSSWQLTRKSATELM